MTLPSDFTQRTQAILGDEFDRLTEALQTEPPVSIRINQAKGSVKPNDGESVKWCDSGYYLPSRPSFITDPRLHGGAYYVQEASSMFLDHVIRQLVHDPVKCLDLCAAPGGKSTLLTDALPKGSLLVSNEVIRQRSHILAENLAKWGAPDVIVTSNDPIEIGSFKHLFDVIVTDVPCSGEGMFRKDPSSINEWSVDNVKLCAARSKRIVQDVWNALHPGGLLIYSTCTYNTEEDEENIHWINETLGAESVRVDIPEDWQITGALKYDDPVYRFLPHKTRGEGFFLAVVRKADDEVETIRPKKEKKQKQTSPLPDSVNKMAEVFSNTYPCKPILYGNSIYLQSPVLFETAKMLGQSLAILNAGILVGELKGNDLIPATELALSRILPQQLFPIVELDYDTAIQYLRKEAITLPEGQSRGYVIVSYQSIRLGFVKNIGNRANNLYPQEWRIRKQL